MTATEQLTRIVGLVAELSRRDRLGKDPVAIADLARTWGVSPKQVAADIRVLTLLGDDAEADWLLSLRAWQQGDMVSVTSGGPFRRPVRLTPEEILALQTALALDPDGEGLARRLSGFWDGGPEPDSGRGPAEPLDDFRARATGACTNQKALRISYASAGAREVSDYILEPHQVVEYQGRTYVVAWVPASDGWKHFRVDRIHDLSETGGNFEKRDDFVPVSRPGDVFRAEDGRWEPVRVRFSPRVARWLKERYPDHDEREDGGVELSFRTSSREWIIRKVLEYGADAEILDPPHYRQAMRRALTPPIW